MEPRIKFLQSPLLSREMPAGGRRPPTQFNVMIIYENCETGKLAKRGLDCVIEELGKDLEFRYTMWRFDILQDPKLNLLATPALAEADLLMISFRGQEQLPAEILVLIGTWLAEEAKCDRALVALFEGTATATDSVYACLANLARQHGLDFFEQALSEAGEQEWPSLKLVWVF